MEKKLVIIDTDIGADDAFAILLALSKKSSLEVVAFTGVFGNANVSTVCNNILKVLKLCDMTQIPVYAGCSRPLVWEEPSMNLIFTNDGLCGIGNQFPHDGLKLQDEHASIALTKLAKQYCQKGIHLICLGPLTNIALAHRLDPDFFSNFQSLSLMGGNVEGIGNTTSAAEYNFYLDPESAHIVLSEAKCPINMVPWEAAENNLIPWDFFEKTLLNIDTEKGRFYKALSKEIAKKDKLKGRKGLMDCDFLAVACLIDPDCIKTKLCFPVSVETQGKFTRGQAIVERRCKNPEQNSVNIITEFHLSSLSAWRISMLED